MRDTFDIPIIGIEPAIKPAAAATKTGVVGVIATTRTITSERYLRLVREFAGTKVKVVSVPCPGLMECVESGDWDSFKTQKLIESICTRSSVQVLISSSSAARIIRSCLTC